MDIIITTETFLLEQFNIQGLYDIHSYATLTYGRPDGGISYFFNSTIGQLINVYKESNMLIVRTTKITIIGLYIVPHRKIEDVVEIIFYTTSKVRKDDKVVLAGDLNSRVGKPNTKTRLDVDMLNDEGFTLVNSKDLTTKFVYNGASTIDFVFYRGKNIIAKSQDGLWSSTACKETHTNKNSNQLLNLTTKTK